jgi:TetR/AcrR family transcriptional repressor of nem operon
LQLARRVTQQFVRRVISARSKSILGELTREAGNRMRKSKSDTAETRKRIVAAAAELFLAQGIATTSILDVMVAAGLTKGGFYRHFESKEQLIAEANRLAFDYLFEMFESKIKGKTPKQALEAIVRFYLCQREIKELVYKCPLSNLGSELKRSDDCVKAVAVDGYERFIHHVARQTERMKIPDHEGVANSIVSMMVGAVALSELMSDEDTARSILANAERAVQALCRPAARLRRA